MQKTNLNKQVLFKADEFQKYNQEDGYQAVNKRKNSKWPLINS